MNRRAWMTGLLAGLAWMFFQGKARADAIVPGRCHMGTCHEMLVEKKTKLRESSVGTLYEVQVRGRSWPMDSPRPSPSRVPFGKADISYVLCSTSSPAYIFSAPESFSSNYVAHRLNPDGQSWFGYNRSSYSIYWVTCHNLVGPSFFSPAMVTRAIQLGYTGNSPEDQIEISHPLDLMR